MAICRNSRPENKPGYAWPHNVSAPPPEIAATDRKPNLPLSSVCNSVAARRHWSSASLTFGQRPRRWPNVKPALDLDLSLSGSRLIWLHSATLYLILTHLKPLFDIWCGHHRYQWLLFCQGISFRGITSNQRTTCQCEIFLLCSDRMSGGLVSTVRPYYVDWMIDPYRFDTLLGLHLLRD